MDYGIDISSWNTVTDWNAVRGNNISFVSVKLTQADNYANPLAQRQVQGARSAQLAVGGYHFADGRKPVSGNVGHFVHHGKALRVFDKGSLAPMLDLEDSPGDGITWTAASANHFVRQFIQQLRDRTGVAPVLVYASQSVWRNMLRPDDWADDNVFLWVALYNGDPGNTGGYHHRRAALHQHTAEGYVPGVQGHVDRNVTLGGFAASHLTIGNVAPPKVEPGPAPQPSPGGWVDHRIEAGQTLSGIAAARGTTVEELARVNGISNPDLIYAGQVIRVPAGGGSGGGGGAATGQYRVQVGDTLGAIAVRFNTTVEAIAAANGISNPNLIYAGQWLDIPTGKPTGGGSTYTVRSGDTLSAIAQRLGVSVDHLVRTNGISNPNLIFPGQVLRH